MTNPTPPKLLDREPSEAMIEAGRLIKYGEAAASRKRAVEIWTAMFDAAPASPPHDGDVRETLTESAAIAAMLPLDTARPETWVLVRIAWPDEQQEGVFGKAALGILRNGTFWGKETRGWWAPSGGMWIDGCVCGWAPIADAALFGFASLPSHSEPIEQAETTPLVVESASTPEGERL